MNDDPYAHDPKRWIGKTVRFDLHGTREVGMVVSQVFAGRTNRGDIPDYKLTVRGKSGTTLIVSLVEQKCSFHD